MGREPEIYATNSGSLLYFEVTSWALHSTKQHASLKGVSLFTVCILMQSFIK